MKNHFYISVYTPKNELPILTYRLEQTEVKQLLKSKKKITITNGELINGMWQSRKNDKHLLSLSAGYVIDTNTFRMAKELFSDDKGFPFVVCMKLTEGDGRGHIQMCGASKIKDDTFEYVVKVAEELFKTYGKTELSTI